MAASTQEHAASQPGVTSEDNNVVDPLVEQMSGLLRLASRQTSAHQQQRARRFSDTAGATAVGPTAMPQPVAVRSKDGSRWLPTLDEQTRVVGFHGASTSVIQPSESPPLERHFCDAAVCAVSKLFETTELLELVLSFLGTKDILALRRTSTHWNQTIQQSPQLRLHFFYYPQFTRPAAEFQLLPLNIPGLSIDLGRPLQLGHWIHVSFNREAARKISPDPKPSKRVRSRSIFEGLRGGLGPRAGTSSETDTWPACKVAETINGTLQYEDLFITQPPLVGMQAFITSSSDRDWWDDGSYGDAEYESDDDDRPVACAKLACDAGITLGFLAETAQSLLAEKKKGDADARVTFKAIVSFGKTESTPRKRSFARTVTRIG